MTLLLIDGRSGAGKTRLASAIARPGETIIHMDDLYQGWDGLDAGSDYLLEALDTRRYQRWDWRMSARAEWVTIPDGPLIVEGVGALTRATRQRADAAIWVELDDETRKQRALARDDHFLDRWGDWAAREAAFISREGPRDLADLVLSGIDVTSHVDACRALLGPTEAM